MDPDFQAIIDKLSKARQAEKPVLQPKVLLIDAMNTFLRSFAIINHINPKGNHIGGLTGFLKSIAAFLATDNTNEVLPIPGRAATTTRSDFCHPPVSLSRPVNPLGTPLRPSCWFRAASICLMAALISVLMRS